LTPIAVVSSKARHTVLFLVDPEGMMQNSSHRTLEWPTLLLLALTYLIWATGTMIWHESAVLSLILTGVAIAQHSSLQHEALHGHPFANAVLNEALVFPALSVFVPYRRFRDTHLQHHYDPALTDPYDDPESNYREPAEWARLPRFRQKLLRWNNTLAGRIVLGPVLGTARFIAADLGLARIDRRVGQAWILHGAGLVLLGIWLMVWGTMPIWAYLIAAYLGLALLRIRTFLEHRAHDNARARTVVVEDRGPLSLLFLNNNFHVVHHMHPSVPWYRLPDLYASRRAHYLKRNDSYVYRNYAEIFRSYLWRAKDTVPHPIWPVKRD
jgi:fatty acid desaturase